eukprot:TRINITY_DN791_c0_g1_i1.p1 TRINITY_DN791_c0_g1~~TRINITY_DN791_c0_g1_i1.p1  ORF type:complete len:218 (-),score=12.42 TRINITY_DN791_c0_g1_i1:551-1204(-)
MSNRTAVSRLRQDYIKIKKDPVPYIVAEPLPSNLLVWHYVVTGPEDSPYKGGMYHGKLVFPREFPFKPPSIYMITPNGRFEINKRLCLSISDYHPDTWNPSWSVSTILTGLLSFMLETTPTLGSIESPDREKRKLAFNSVEHNLGNKTFCELFPDLKHKAEAEIERRKTASLQPPQTFQAAETTQTLPTALSFFLNFGGIAAFALIVNYVIQSLEMD